MSEANSVVTFVYCFFVINAALFGIVIGSFLNVVIYRLPAKRTIVKGHSMCMTCGHTLGVLDLVPLFSWLFLKGKCRYCGDPIASRYSKIESFTGLVFLIAALTHMGTAFVIVAPNSFYISWFVQFIVFLVASCVCISAMMIYHDTKKGFKGLAITSVICSLIAETFKQLNLTTTIPTLLITLLTVVLIPVIGSLLIKLIFVLFHKNYSKADFCMDVGLLAMLCHSDYTVILPPFFKIPVMPIEAFIYVVIYGIIRGFLKDNKNDKLAGIIGFLLIVILVIIRYSIMTFVYKF